MTRLEGPMTGGDPMIDFTEENWNWGEILPEQAVQLVGDRVAEVIWGEIIQCLNEHKGGRGPYIGFDDASGGGIEGGPVLVVHILDTHCIVIPLDEIIIDGDMMVILGPPPARDCDRDQTIARLEQTRSVFAGWAAEIDQLIAETKP